MLNNSSAAAAVASGIWSDLRAVGYVVDPNNIHSLPGVLAYPCGEAIWTVPRGHETQVLHDRIRVFTKKFFGAHYERESYWDTVTVAVFASADAFLAWCREFGMLSEPALPAFYQGWD